MTINWISGNEDNLSGVCHSAHARRYIPYVINVLAIIAPVTIYHVSFKELVKPGVNTEN